MNELSFPRTISLMQQWSFSQHTGIKFCRWTGQGGLLWAVYYLLIGIHLLYKTKCIFSVCLSWCTHRLVISLTSCLVCCLKGLLSVTDWDDVALILFAIREVPHQMDYDFLFTLEKLSSSFSQHQFTARRRDNRQMMPLSFDLSHSEG